MHADSGQAPRAAGQGRRGRRCGPPAARAAGRAAGLDQAVQRARDALDAARRAAADGARRRDELEAKVDELPRAAGSPGAAARDGTESEGGLHPHGRARPGALGHGQGGERLGAERRGSHRARAQGRRGGDQGRRAGSRAGARARPASRSAGRRSARARGRGARTRGERGADRQAAADSLRPPAAVARARCRGPAGRRYLRRLPYLRAHSIAGARSGAASIWTAARDAARSCTRPMPQGRRERPARRYPAVGERLPRAGTPLGRGPAARCGGGRTGWPATRPPDARWRRCWSSGARTPRSTPSASSGPPSPSCPIPSALAGMSRGGRGDHGDRARRRHDPGPRRLRRRWPVRHRPPHPRTPCGRGGRRRVRARIGCVTATTSAPPDWPRRNGSARRSWSPATAGSPRSTRSRRAGGRHRRRGHRSPSARRRAAARARRGRSAAGGRHVRHRARSAAPASPSSWCRRSCRRSACRRTCRITCSIWWRSRRWRTWCRCVGENRDPRAPRPQADGGEPVAGAPGADRGRGAGAARELRAGHMGYMLGPRLNAVGRIGDAADGLRLLLTDDPDEAIALARRLEGLNVERQALDHRILEEALAQVEQAGDPERDAGFVLVGRRMASRVSSASSRRGWSSATAGPAFLIAFDGDVGKGSGRSISRFDLHAALHACGDLLERYGGHQMAAGLTIRRPRLDEFRERFGEDRAGGARPGRPRAGAAGGPRDRARRGDPRARADVAPSRAVRGGQCEPRLRRAWGALRRSVARGQRAPQGRLDDGGTRLAAIGFQWADRVPWLGDGPVDAAFRLESNEWNGHVRCRRGSAR